MPKNTGTPPPHAKVDIKLRQGQVVRGVDPKGYRWKPWPDGPHDGDVVFWQIAK